MCEQAAEAHKSKALHSRRSKTSSDLGSSSRDSLTIDAMLSKKSSTLSQVMSALSKFSSSNVLQQLLSYFESVYVSILWLHKHKISHTSFVL